MNLSGKKTLKNKFQWTPKHLGYEKGSRPIPPLKIDSRLPKLWITSLPPEEKELTPREKMLLARKKNLQRKRRQKLPAQLR